MRKLLGIVVLLVRMLDHKQAPTGHPEMAACGAQNLIQVGLTGGCYMGEQGSGVKPCRQGPVLCRNSTVQDTGRLSTGTTAMQADPKFSSRLQKMDVLFTSIFAAEMAIKTIAHGFLFGPNTYLQSRWNMLDAAIITVSTAVLLLDGPALQVMRILRFVRLLRPLQAVRHFSELRVIVNALLRSLKGTSLMSFVQEACRPQSSYLLPPPRQPLAAPQRYLGLVDIPRYIWI